MHRGGVPLSRHCEICDGEEFDVIATKDRRDNAMETGMCRRCGLVAHMQIPTAAEEADYYATKYRLDYHAETTPSAHRVIRSWRLAEALFDRLARFISPPGRVFEVGAGLGCYVKRFELGGFEATGIEPGERWHDFSTNRLHARVENRRLEDLPPDPTNDLVLLVHVIEHFRAPREALRRIAAHLKPGGLLYVECPNLGAPFTRRPLLFHRAHIHNFTASSLTMLAQRCGFETVASLEAPSHPNLAMVFRHVGREKFEIDPENGRRTLEAIARFDGVRFFVRPAYYWHRLRALGRRVRERLSAPRELRRLLRRVAGESA